MARASFVDNLYTPNTFDFIPMVGDRKRGEIVAIKSLYTQWQPAKSGPNAGVQQPPLTSVVLSLVEIDEAGQHIGEPIDKELRVQYGPKDDSMIKVRPGNAPDRTSDPEDTRDEDGVLVLNTEGNTLFIDDSDKSRSFQYSKTAPFIVFALSCKDVGFKKEILDAGYLQDYVGFQAWFTRRPGTRDSKFDDFVVDAPIKFPYEKKAVTGKVAKASTETKAKVNGAVKPVVTASTPAQEVTDNGSTSASEDAVQALTELFPTFKKPTKKAAISLAVAQHISKQEPTEAGRARAKAAYDLVRSQNWLDENVLFCGGNLADSKAGPDMYVYAGE